MSEIRKDIFRAIVELVELDGAIFFADKDPGCQMVIFSFEPDDCVLPFVRKCIESVLSLTIENPLFAKFEIVVFTRTGCYECRSDMSPLSRDNEPFDKPLFPPENR